MEGSHIFLNLIIVILFGGVSSVGISRSINKRLFSVGETLEFTCHVYDMTPEVGLVQIFKPMSHKYDPYGKISITTPIVISNNTELNLNVTADPGIAARYHITEQWNDMDYILVLTITDIQVEDFGGYSCHVVTNGFNLTTNPYDVDVIGDSSAGIATSTLLGIEHSEPEFLANNTEIIANASSNSVVECVYNVTGVFPKIYIGFGGKNITEQLRKSSSVITSDTASGLVRLEMVYRYWKTVTALLPWNKPDQLYKYHGRTFVCSAELGGKNTSVFATFNVPYVPQLFKCLKWTNESTISITCSCHGNPTPMTTWVTPGGWNTGNTSEQIHVDGSTVTSTLTVTGSILNELPAHFQYKATNSQGETSENITITSEDMTEPGSSGCNQSGDISVWLLAVISMVYHVVMLHTPPWKHS